MLSFRQSILSLALFLVLSTAAQQPVAAGTNEAGLAFLAENKEKEGVITLSSGLQYKVLRKGRGMDHPAVNAPCLCHYEGTLLDGSVFDSSYERGSPTTFAPNQVIKGWTEAMQMMVVGDKWEMYIPSELGYGDHGSPPKIRGGDVLVFRMEILAIQGETVPALKCSVLLRGNGGDNDGDDDDDGCNDREKTYASRVRSWYAEGDDTKARAQLARIRKILSAPMKDDLREWARRRANILEQFVEKQNEQQEL